MFAFSRWCLILFGMLLNIWPWLHRGATNFTGHCVLNKKYFFLSGSLNVPLFFNYKAGWIGELDLPSLCRPLFYVPLLCLLLFISFLNKISAICSGSLHMKILPRSQPFLLLVPKLVPLHFETGNQTTTQGTYIHVCICNYTPPAYTITPSFGCAFSIQWAFGLVFRDSCTLRSSFQAAPAEAHALLPTPMVNCNSFS